MWQGPSPHQGRDLVGFRSHDPVKQFPANGNGLYDMAGNVWGWVNERYTPDYFGRSPVDNQRGPRSGGQRLQREGWWLFGQS